MHADRQGIDKHPEGPFRPCRTLQAAGDHGTEDHVIATSATGQHLGPGDMEQHGRGHPAFPCQVADLPAEGVAQLHLGFFDVVAVALDFQQIERRGGLLDIGQAAAEVVFVDLGRRGEDMRDKLPIRLRGRQIGRLALHQQANFLEDDFLGDVIADHMMVEQGQQPTLGVRVAGDAGAHQRRLLQVQAHLLRIGQAIQLGVQVFIRRQGEGLDRQLRLAMDHLDRLRQADPVHRAAQDVMSVDDPLQGFEKGVEARAVVELDHRAHHVGVALIVQQVMEEDALLQRRQGVDVLDIGGPAGSGVDDLFKLGSVQFHQWQHVRCQVRAVGRDTVGRRLEQGLVVEADGLGHFLHAGCGEHGADTGIQALLAQAVDQADGQQRVAAEFEEAVVAADLLNAQQVLPDSRDNLLDLAARCLVGAAGKGIVRRGRQGLAVEFAIWRQWQRVENHEGAWQHVFGQLRRQFRTQTGGIEVRFWLGDHIGHQAFFSRTIFAGDHHGLFDPGAVAEARLDFSQFDTETTDFDLEVVTTQVFDTTVGHVARQVARLVHPGIGAGAEWIDEETLGVNLFEVQVTPRHAVATNENLTSHAIRYGLLMGVEQVDTGVGHRLADGRIATAFAAGHGIVSDIGRGARDCCLGRTIGVDQPCMRRADFIPELELLCRERVAGDVDQAHISQTLCGDLWLVVPFSGEGVPVGGGHMQESRTNAVILRAFAAEDLLAWRQGGPGQQRREDFLHRQVEVQGVLLQHGVRRSQTEQPCGIEAVVDQATVFDHHSFWITGGAGGVDHIGQVACAQGWHDRVMVTFSRLIVVEQYQRQRQCRQAFLQYTLGQQCRRLAVLDHVGQTFDRIGRVQRHIGCTGLEHAQQADHHFHATFDADRHPIIRADAQADQVMGQAVGLAVQFGIAQALRLEGHRDGLRLREDLFLEQLMNGAVLRIRHFGCIEAHQQMLTLAGIKQRHVFQHLAVIRNHGFQQTLEVTEVTNHGAFVEQRRGVFQRTEQTALGFAQVQGDIEFGQGTGCGQIFELQIAEGEVRAAQVLPGQHRLEDRAVGQAAHRLDHFHHLLERQVLMGLGTEGTGLDPGQQCLGGRLFAEVDADRQGVDEQADQPFDFTACAVGHRRTDHHVVLAGQAAQQRGPGAHDGHIQGGAVTLTEGLEATGQVLVEAHRQRGTGIVLLRRTHPVGRQHQQCWCLRQGLLPIAALLLQQIATEPATLPHGVVQVLERQRCQRIVLTLAERGIERGELAGQHGNRPAIGDDMVHGHQQDMMVLGQFDQTATNQRPLCQVERLQCFLSGQHLELGFGIRQPLQIVQLQAEAGIRRGNPLQGLFVITQGKGGAQAFVARDDALQRPLQGHAVKGAAQAEAARHMVGRAGTFHLREEPQTLLGEGQRPGLVTRHRHDLRQRTAPGLGNHLGQGRQLGMGKQLRQAHLNPQSLADLRNQTHRQQRVTAQFEELVMAADLGQAEQFLPELGQGDFYIALRRRIATADHRLQIRRRQGLAVELAVGAQRQAIQVHKGTGYHVFGQMFEQLDTQLPGRCRFAAQVGDQALAVRLPRIVLAGNHHHFTHTGAQGQGGLDFADFDAQAANLHLEVIAAQVFQGAVGQPAPQVASLVQARLRIAGKRVGDKTFGAQLWLVQVTAGDTDAADMQFPGHTQGLNLAQGIQHIHLDIGNRPADRHAFARIARTALPGSDVNGRFGRAIEVMQLDTRQLLLEASLQATGQGLTAAQHATQVGEVAV